MPESEDRVQDTLSEEDSEDAWDIFEREFRNFPKRQDEGKFRKALERFKKMLKNEAKGENTDPKERETKELLIDLMIERIKKNAESRHKKGGKENTEQTKLNEIEDSLDFLLKSFKD